jgi:hypothetical protein
MSAVDSLIKSAQTAGTGFSLIGLAVSVIIGAIFVAAGLIIIFKTPKVYKVNGIIKSATFDIADTYKLQINYTYNNKSYAITVPYSFKRDTGDTISVYVDPKDPSNGSLMSRPSKLMGVAVIIVAILLVGFCYFWYRLTKSNTFIGAATGAEGIYHLF